MEIIDYSNAKTKDLKRVSEELSRIKSKITDKCPELKGKKKDTKRERIKKKYSGDLIRFYCPSLYRQPVYDEEGEFIQYIITIPILSMISAKDL